MDLTSPVFLLRTQTCFRERHLSQKYRRKGKKNNAFLTTKLRGILSLNSFLHFEQFMSKLIYQIIPYTTEQYIRLRRKKS